MASTLLFLPEKARYPHKPRQAFSTYPKLFPIWILEGGGLEVMQIFTWVHFSEDKV